MQYACREYIALLEEAKMRDQHVEDRQPLRNMESFFKTLKYEEVHLANYESYDDVAQNRSTR